MANCRACGGILGRDCYNESDCMQISQSYDQNGYFNNGDLEHYISILIYTMEQKGLKIPNSHAAEPPLIMKLHQGCKQQFEYSYLPF